MPTGETPQAQFKQGDQLQQGQASGANALMGLVGPATPPEPHQPQGPEEQFLFSPTDRPGEPITHGAPFGPGAPNVRGAFSSDADVVSQVATQLQQADVGADTKAWLARAQVEG